MKLGFEWQIEKTNFWHPAGVKAKVGVHQWNMRPDLMNDRFFMVNQVDVEDHNAFTTDILL